MQRPNVMKAARSSICALRMGVSWFSLMLDRVCVSFTVLLLIAILLDITLSVFYRYVLNNPLMWTDEVGRYMMVWLAFLGAPIAFRRNAHIGLEWLYNRLAPGLHRAVTLLIQFIVIAIFTMIIVVSFPILHRLTGSHSPMMLIPMVIPYASVTTGSALLVVQTVNLILSGKSDGKKE